MTAAILIADDMPGVAPESERYVKLDGPLVLGRRDKREFARRFCREHGHPIAIGDRWVFPDGVTLPKIAGGATAPAAPAPAPITDPFLRYARTMPYPVLQGTLAAGRAGGTAADLITWNPATIPEVPSWCSELDFIVNLPVTTTQPASSTLRISPYAPYSAFSMQMILAGSPEWPANMSLVPFWLDEITNDRNYDPAGYGPNIVSDIANAAGVDSVPLWFDRGASPTSFATGISTVLPGQTITAGGSPVTTRFIMQFTVRVRFQRNRTKLWGCVPLGDPQNRPFLKLQLNSLVGPQPENALIQDVAAAGITATVDTGGIVCQAVFRSKSLDVLPGSVQQLASPGVGLGLNVTYDNSFAIQNAGAILYQYQRTAQIYTDIHHLFVNNQQAIDPDYFGLWLTQNRASARWEYDAALGTMQDWYAQTLRTYKRYLPKGYLNADLDAGVLPDAPRETPYNALMSPDVAYATAAGVAATPNMSTAFRIPAGTSMVGAYVGIYSFGLVRVPY